LQAGLHQDVVENPGDRDTERLLDVVRVQRDLEVGPEFLEVVGIELRCRLVFKHEVVAADAHDAVDLAGEHKAARRGAGRRIDDRPWKVFSSATISNSSVA